ncbi:MAG: DNA polymerase III subunit delta, partial [Clostridia bacterium]|nr:DNA polymerase III subunit delta [Clostridia bacterium]
MAHISVSDLKKQISNSSFGGFYFLFGQEKYLIKQYTQNLISSILCSNINDFNFKAFNSEELNLRELEDAIETVPFLSPNKCILVQDLDIDSLSSEEIKRLKEIIANIPAQTVLIFSHMTLEVDMKKSSKLKAFLKSLENIGSFVEFTKLSKSDLAKYLIKLAEKADKELSQANAYKLIDFCGENLLDLKNELEKLVAFSTAEKILSEDIDQVASKKLEANIFDLSKAISQKNLKKALGILNILLDKKEEPIAIVSLIASAYIDIYRTKVCHATGVPIKEIANHFDYKRKEFRLD